MLFNTSFSLITGVRSVIHAINTKLSFKGSVIFKSIQNTYSIISSHLTMHNYTEILNNTVYTLLNGTEVYLEEELICIEHHNEQCNTTIFIIKGQ